MMKQIIFYLKSFAQPSKKMLMKADVLELIDQLGL